MSQDLLWNASATQLISTHILPKSVSVGATPELWMGVEVATNVSERWKKTPGIDGILGLGFRELSAGWLTSIMPPHPIVLISWEVSPAKVASFMERLVGANVSTLPVFTVDFDPIRNGNKPTVEVGKIDLQKAENGTLFTAPVDNKDGWWAVNNVSFQVGNTRLQIKHSMLMGNFFVFLIRLLLLLAWGLFY